MFHVAVSASIIKTIIDRCERAAWHESWLNPDRERDFTKATDTGTIAHGILLEGSTAGIVIIDPRDHPAEKTGNIPDGWTNKSIREARDAARRSGKIPVLSTDMAPIENMVDAAHGFIETLRDTEPAIWAAMQPGGGRSEETMVWREGETLCRLRTDRISNDNAIIVDYKTSAMSVEPDRWGRTQLTGMGYYISAAWYRRGIAALTGVTPDYVFLCQETEAPYLCSLVGVDPAGLALGEEKCMAGLKQWERCVRDGHWPAYPNRVTYPELAPWESTRWAERQGVDEHGIPYDISKLFERKETA